MNEEKTRKPRKNTKKESTPLTSTEQTQRGVKTTDFPDFVNVQHPEENIASKISSPESFTEEPSSEKKVSRVSRKPKSRSESVRAQKKSSTLKKDQIKEQLVESQENFENADPNQKAPTLLDITIKKNAKRGPKKHTQKKVTDPKMTGQAPFTQSEPSDIDLKEQTHATSHENLITTQKTRRGRPKRGQAMEQDLPGVQEDVSQEAQSQEVQTVEAQSQEAIKDENTQEKKQVREVTSQRRKPGRPPKKPITKPLTSLLKTTSQKEESLAISQTQRLSIAEEKRLALVESQKIALETNQKMVLDASKNLALQEHIRDDEAHPLLLTQNVYDKQDQEENASVQDENAQEEFDTSRSKARNQRKSRNAKKLRQHKKSADFIAGEYGTSQNSESQELYEERAALGVMGIIDEAPLVDALLPLVFDTQDPQNTTSKIDTQEHAPKDVDEHALQEQDGDGYEKTSSKKSRRSRRGRKADARAQKQEQEALNAEKADFYVDADSAPIAEGDVLSLLEAEESVKKAGKSVKGKVQKEQINRVLYVSCVPDEQVEVVITENGIVSEYFIEMEHQAKIRGNIYKGVINNVDTNLQAAFVNFGGAKNGFLQIDEVHPEYWLTPQHSEDGKVEGGGKYPPIQKVLKVGQEVLVQVVKEPAGTKGAFLTTWISLAGRFIVLTPGQEQIGVSRKVEDNTERTRLRELLTGIKPGENMGVIIRTASEGASKANIQNDLKFLKRVWKDVQKKVQKANAPSLIHQEADLPSRAVRDYLTSDISEVWVDSEEVRESLQDLIAVVFPKNKDILKTHKDARSTLWERFNILRQLDEVTKREVVLPSGGRLVFDQTEALMAIDINSGKTHGKINFEAMVFRTNMEAVEAIARHLRLRDIGGQVVIDFIEMRDRGHCREVEKAMRIAMKRDRARHDVGRLSSFGLLELVRQRTGTSAISISSEPCPHCRGTGFRRNLEWQAQGVLRDIKSKLSSGKNMPSTYVHHVEQEVAFYLLNKKRDRLSELEEKFGLKIEIHVK